MYMTCDLNLPQDTYAFGMQQIKDIEELTQLIEQIQKGSTQQHDKSNMHVGCPNLRSYTTFVQRYSNTSQAET